MKNKFALLNLILGFVTATSIYAADSSSSWQTAPIVHTSFFDWASLKVKTTPVGQSRFVADAPSPTLNRLECHITTLRPGCQSHPPHHHPQEEMILIKEGTVESYINGKKQRFGAGSLLFLASHDLHNVTNIGDTPTTYFVINFHTAATATVREEAAEKWAPKSMLPSSVIDWNKLETKQTSTGTRTSLVNSQTLTYKKLEVHATTLNPGTEASKAHRHPWLQLFIIKQGKVEFTVDGVKHTSGASDMVYVESNAIMSLKNVGNDVCSYTVFSVTTDSTPSEKKS